MIQSDSN